MVRASFPRVAVPITTFGFSIFESAPSKGNVCATICGLGIPSFLALLLLRLKIFFYHHHSDVSVSFSCWNHYVANSFTARNRRGVSFSFLLVIKTCSRYLSPVIFVFIFLNSFLDDDNSPDTFLSRRYGLSWK